MRHHNIKPNQLYRLKDNGNYDRIRALKVLMPKQEENTNNYIVVKCEHFSHFGAITEESKGLIRYFKPKDIKPY